MLNRRVFAAILASLFGVSASCSYRTTIKGLTGATSNDLEVLESENITTVTTGFVALSALIFLTNTLNDDQLNSSTTDELQVHTRIVKSEIEALYRKRFEVVESVSYEEQLNRFKENTAIVDWREARNLIDFLNKEKGENSAKNFLYVVKELFGEDYKYIETAK